MRTAPGHPGSSGRAASAPRGHLPEQKAGRRQTIQRLRKLARTSSDAAPVFAAPVFYVNEADLDLNARIGAVWARRGRQPPVLAPGKNPRHYLAGTLRALGPAGGLRSTGCARPRTYLWRCWSACCSALAPRRCTFSCTTSASTAATGRSQPLLHNAQPLAGSGVGLLSCAGSAFSGGVDGYLADQLRTAERNRRLAIVV